MPFPWEGNIVIFNGEYRAVRTACHREPRAGFHVTWTGALARRKLEAMQRLRGCEERHYALRAHSSDFTKAWAGLILELPETYKGYSSCNPT